MGEESAELLKILNEVNTNVSDLKIKVERLSDAQNRDHKLLSDHDRILVRGGETTPSLQETIRAMVKHQDRLIEEIAIERKETKERLVEEAERKLKEESTKEGEWNKWKWTLIGLGVTILPKLLWDAVIFWNATVLPSLKVP